MIGDATRRPAASIADALATFDTFVAAQNRYSFMLRSDGKAQAITEKLAAKYQHAIVVKVVDFVGIKPLKDHLDTILKVVVETRQSMVIFNLTDLNHTSEHSQYLQNWLGMLVSDHKAIISNIFCVSDSLRFSISRPLEARMINLDIE